MVAPFDEGDFKPRLLRLPQGPNLAGFGAAAIERNSGL